MNELLSVGPENVADDEGVIAGGYRLWFLLLPAIGPIAVAWFADTKWVLAVGFALVIGLIPHLDGRLHDLCIRVRRTNLLLRGIRDNDL
jgi:hypothetical protein